MFAYVLALAAAAAAGTGERIITVDGRPTIHLGLTGYDLLRPDDLRRLKRNIRTAAREVCRRSYRDATYSEVVSCVKVAAAEGEAQLGTIVAHNSTASPLPAAIAVSAPAN